jgi:hypothetical protein
MAKHRGSGKLSAAAVDRAKPGMHGAGGGLYLAVGASGSRSWIFRYRHNGRSREFGLGSASVVGLAAARDRAVDARRLLADGIDPIERRDSERAAAKAEAAKAITFGDYAKTFIAGRSAGWRNAKHADQWRMTLLGIVPSKVKGEPDKPAKHDYCKLIRNIPVGDVDATAVLKVLTPIWQTRPETASRIRSRIENLLDAAKAKVCVRARTRRAGRAACSMCWHRNRRSARSGIIRRCRMCGCQRS